MGHLKDKYNKDYFLGFKKEGSDIIYGATIVRNDSGEMVLRDHDVQILSKINFENKRVLELGYGRGEAAKYALEKGASYYEGIDFSESAHELAVSLYIDSPVKPLFHTGDALPFVDELKKLVLDKEIEPFDILIMLDFVEHVPRDELKEILANVSDCLREKSIVAINTPVYKYDNDAIREGLNLLNNIDCSDLSDTIPETEGMHCNKYTLISLPDFMWRSGFKNLTSHNYYVKKGKIEEYYKPYDKLWESYLSEGYPLLGEYVEDVIEYPYVEDMPEKILAVSGILEGISIKTTPKYYSIAYNEGEFEPALFKSFIDLTKRKEAITIFDVGGFIGVTSLLFSKYTTSDSQVIVFEPNPYNRNRLLENLSINSELDNKIKVSSIALSNETGLAKMFLSSSIDDGYSSTSRINSSHPKITNQDLSEDFFEFLVKMDTLDNFVKRTSDVPDIIKLDIEGAEHLFLEGAKETIRKYKPIFYIELHSEFCALKCTELLVKEGYSLEVLTEEKDGRIFIKAEV